MAEELARQSERRKAPRHSVSLPVHIMVRGERVACRMHNVSTGGALLDRIAGIELDTEVEVDIPGIGNTVGRVVRVSASYIALAFSGLLVISPIL